MIRSTTNTASSKSIIINANYAALRVVLSVATIFTMKISEAVADEYNNFFLRNLIMWQPFVVSLEIAYWLQIAAGDKERSENFEGWLDDYYGRYYIDAPEPQPFVGPLKPAPFTRQGYRVVSVSLDRINRPRLALRRLVARLGWYQ